MSEEPEEESTEARFRRVQEELRAMELSELPDEEVDARLSDLKERRIEELPSIPDVDARLSALESRTRKAQVVHNQAKGGDEATRASDGKAAKGLGVGLAIAYTFLGLSMAGLGIGYLIDRATGGDSGKGLGTVIGAALGIGFAVFLSNRESPRL